jgi:hypothetical protein
MSFSVDYQFVQGAPDPAGQYLWVIEPARGKPVEMVVQLESEGTLQWFVETLRPESGPFQSHLAEAKPEGGRLAISVSVPMRL